jgi:hypothetical protein
VTALDASENVATSYTGTLHLTSTDAQAAITTDYPFTTGTGKDNGVHTFNVTLKTAGPTLVTMTDTMDGLSASPSITVLPGPAATFAVSGYPASITEGFAGNVTVAAQDAFGNTATSYAGTVRLTTTDTQAVLPANYTFTTGSGGDNGLHIFAVTLKTVGTQSITATDTAAHTITGTQGGIVVRPPAAVNLSITAPTSASAGSGLTITVTARDASGNATPGYSGTVHFASSDHVATLPADYTFVAGDSGTHSFSVTLKTAGTQSLTATDMGAGTASPSQVTINVLPVLTGISPGSGDVKGGTKVTLSGAGFSAGATIFFGAAAGTNATVVNGTTITVTVPAHAAGAVDVKVTTGGVTLTLSGGYTYGTVSPIPAPARGGPGIGPVIDGPPPSPLPGQRPPATTAPGASPGPLPPSR